MPKGRPTLYKPEYCELILSGEYIGLFNVQIANRLKVTEETLYEWARRHKDFSVSLTRARQNCLEKHLETGIQNITTGEFTKLNEKTLHVFLHHSGFGRRLPRLKGVDDENKALAIVRDALANGEICVEYAESATKLLTAKMQVKKDTTMAEDLKLIKEKLNLE